MTLDTNQLDAALSGLASLSDADAATALSAPILTPRPEPLTFASLGSIWGFSTAAGFRAGLDAMAAGSDASAAALAKLAISVLTSGLVASDPQSVAAAQEFVAAGLCTTDQMTTALYLPPTYRCGSPVQASDVTTARARLARQAVLATLTGAGASLINEYLPAFADPATAAPTAAEMVAQLQTLLTAAGVA